MRKLIIGFAALAVALAYTAGPLRAADVKVGTKIFLEKPGKKTKWLSKDAAVSADPNNITAGKVTFCTEADPNGETFNVGPYTANGSGTVFKSKTGCKITLVKPGKLAKTLCSPGATKLTVPQDPNNDIGINVIIGSTRLCARCGGTPKGNATKLTKRKDCAAPAACLCTGSPSGSFLELSSF
jgi:hypothetical protein